MSLEPEQAPKETIASALLSRRRLLYILVGLVVEVAIFFAGLLTPLSQGTREALVNATGSQFGNATSGTYTQLVGYIFTHNVSIAIPEMIPVAGALLFAVSVFTTGIAAQALVSSQGLPVQWGAIIFAFPYSLVELTAYAVALVAGFTLLAAWRNGRLGRELWVFGAEGMLVVMFLFAAAAMEAATVKISFLLGFALWVPTGVVLALSIVIIGRKRG